jgi:hypothetical protein
MDESATERGAIWRLRGLGITGEGMTVLHDSDAGRNHGLPRLANENPRDNRKL